MEHSSAFLALVNEARKNIKEVSIDDVREMMDESRDFALIDVREESEWSRGRIAGAVYLGKGIIERDIERFIPDTSKEIVMYCGGGFRSVLTTETLQKMGYTNVYSMAGGWREWRESGFAIET